MRNPVRRSSIQRPRGRGAGVPVRNPCALRSSSTSGQCTPSPPPMRRQLRRCASVAASRRHDHDRGTLTIRPSRKWATIAWLVTSTEASLGELSGLVAVLIPHLHDGQSILKDKSPNSAKIAAWESVIVSKINSLKPELATRLFAFDMHVPRFSTVRAVEKQAVRSWQRDSRHGRVCIPSAAAASSFHSACDHSVAECRPAIAHPRRKVALRLDGVAAGSVEAPIRRAVFLPAAGSVGLAFIWHLEHRV